jgi:OmpA-OmpF porin, OOP family
MRNILIGLLVLLTITAGARADDMPPKDMIPGAKDHPLLSRYTGSIMVAYLAKTYDEADLVAGKFKPAADNGPPFEKMIHAEGKITRLVYNYPQDRSSVEVMRNFRAALQGAGLTIEFSCDKANCAATPEDFGGAVENLKIDQNRENWPEYAYSSPFNYGRFEPRYTLASLRRPDGAVTYLAVYVVSPLSGQNGGILIEIVEPTAMETGSVTVNLTADAMAKAISADGKVAVYGLYFDTDRTELRPDSKPSLDEIAKLLHENPKLNVYVVGHTDNQGSPAHNLDLAQKRSESIVHTLIGDYKINAGRLLAKGVASFAPVATNETEAGRARNRRVELVKQ